LNVGGWWGGGGGGLTRAKPGGCTSTIDSCSVCPTKSVCPLIYSSKTTGPIAETQSVLGSAHQEKRVQY
jgi:hypothetical protein